MTLTRAAEEGYAMGFSSGIRGDLGLGRTLAQHQAVLAAQRHTQEVIDEFTRAFTMGFARGDEAGRALKGRIAGKTNVEIPDWQQDLDRLQTEHDDAERDR